MFSLDGKRDRLLTAPNKHRAAYLLSRCSCSSTRGIYFRSLPRSRTHTLGHRIIGLASVRFARCGRLLWILFLATGPRDSHHLTVGCSLSLYVSFVLAEPAHPIQHIRKLTQRADFMEHNHLPIDEANAERFREQAGPITK